MSENQTLSFALMALFGGITGFQQNVTESLGQTLDVREVFTMSRDIFMRL